MDVHKADETRFSVRFNPADPQHRLAMEILNRAGRRKAFLIADAVCSYYGISNRADVGNALEQLQNNIERQSLQTKDSCTKAEAQHSDCSHKQPENLGAMFQGISTVLRGLATVLENLPTGSQNSVVAEGVTSGNPTSSNISLSSLLTKLQPPQSSRCNLSSELGAVDWASVVMSETNNCECGESEAGICEDIEDKTDKSNCDTSFASGSVVQ